MVQGKSTKHPVFAEKLRQLRVSRGRTQQDIALKLGTSRNTYSSWEEGVSRPKHEMGKKIAEIYNISVESLYDDAIPFARLAQPNTQKPTPQEAGNTSLELNEALTRALIRAHDEMIEANTAHRKLTSALLEEKGESRRLPSRMRMQSE